MQKLIIIIALGLFSSIALTGQEYLVVMGKTVLIKGKTSFGRFSCTYQNGHDQDTVSLSKIANAESLMELFIPVASFDCGNRMLERDFGKTLRYEEYPSIEVRLDDFKRVGQQYYGDIWIKLTGKEMKMERIPFTLTPGETGEVLYSEITISLDYFELSPPKKLFGLIKVQDELKIELSLKL
ncbi:MAG: hypothetical protein COW03_05315 [Cytophagales bacterium CG12_big_fil_rev_8_21_14_0_65_40_12]|nr:MAG: hypothetical protein COW03_05315 [Cytophagales bacterium CG12_big_fil_rev_8_21_14_0_65_40_12]PIW05899.1 MAG: hypothetical protein COW40_02305 [Cytophagales bacterium CG17_big_fil_post_rev_8_21_14_2_50_40_13]